MTNRQDCRFAQPQVAPTGAEYKDVLREFEWLEHDIRRAVTVRGFQGPLRASFQRGAKHRVASKHSSTGREHVSEDPET